MCSSQNGVKTHDLNPDLRSDVPISAQGLPAICLEGLSAVFFIRRPFYQPLEGLYAVFMADWRNCPQIHKKIKSVNENLIVQIELII